MRRIRGVLFWSPVGGISSLVGVWKLDVLDGESVCVWREMEWRLNEGVLERERKRCWITESLENNCD
jgi:hypothetical protein